MTYKILYGEDELDMQSLVGRILQKEEFKVVFALNGQEVLDHWRRESFDCILLDIMMPVMDGLEACRRIRRVSNIPIILITAKGEEEEAVKGFEAGADDFIQKPFRQKELVARVRTAITRAERNRQNEKIPLVYGHLIVDPQARRIVYRGKDVEVTPLEFQLMYYLMRHPGAVFSKEELFKNVWGYPISSANEEVDLNLIEAAIRRLRKKVEEDPSRPRIIQTVWGSGYRLGN
jgi:two-component system response regulator MtrA